MNAWLIRPVPHGTNRILEFRTNDIIAIGWPDTGDLQGKSREQLKTILSQPPYSLMGLALGNSYATVDLFVNQMRLGDYVLVPDGDDIYFAVVESNYYFDVSADKDGYSHQRKVKWLSDTSRQKLSKPLRTSLKVHRTAADLSHHFDEISALASGKEYIPAVTPSINVTYPLRPQYTISFSIPDDITKDEAKRLSDYLKTLYFAEED